MISFSSKYRSNQDEIMDNFDLKGPAMKELMTDLKRVNSLLGGNSITLSGIHHLVQNTKKERPLTVLDIGCGDGEMLRQIAMWGRKEGRQLHLIGIDANSHILKEAEARSNTFQSIVFKHEDIFKEGSALPEFDIALCTLFLHHFKEPQICDLLQNLVSNAKVGVVVNDLQRSGVAF
ncbi:MAG: methyltransferase domain-containing protein [Bacteroidota bacterium]